MHKRYTVVVPIPHQKTEWGLNMESLVQEQEKTTTIFIITRKQVTDREYQTAESQNAGI